MTLRARVGIVNSDNAESLIRAFFREFNPKNSILIRDEEARVKIVFDKPPEEIIRAITDCQVMYFQYGDTLEDWNEDEPEQPNEEAEEAPAQHEEEEEPQQTTVEAEEAPTQPEEEEEPQQTTVEAEEALAQLEEEEEPQQTTVEAEEAPAQPEEAKEPYQTTAVAQAISKKQNKRGRRAKEIQTVDISRLEEIAQKATSFEHFAKLVAEWLEMEKRQDFFVNLAIAAGEVDVLSWPNVEKVLERKGITYTEWDKIWTSKQVSKKFDERVKIMSLLNAMSQYKEYSFGNKPAEEVSNTQVLGEVLGKTASNTTGVVSEEKVHEKSPENVAAEDPSTKSEEQVAEVLESMQEEIPGLSEIVEQSASYEDFLNFVTTWIGFTDEKYDMFVNILKVATNMENITWKNIVENLNKQNIKCGSSEYNSCSQKLYKKFKDVTTVVRFIKVIVTYKEFEFKGEGRYVKPVEVSNNIAPQKEGKPQKQESNSSRDVRSKHGLKMACMPEIPYFEKKLAQLDRNQPVEERVKYVLEAMGLKSIKPQVQKCILDTVNEAMELKDNEFESYLFKKQMSLNERMAFATFVNDFVKLHGSDLMVKLSDFLRDLQKVVMFEG